MRVLEEGDMGIIKNYEFAYYLMERGFVFTQDETKKLFKEYVKKYDDEATYETRVCFDGFEDPLLYERMRWMFIISQEPWNGKKHTPININHKLKDDIWKNSLYDNLIGNKDKLSIEELCTLYRENCMIASKNNRELDEVVNTVKLDNNKILKFNLKVDEEDFKVGNFNHENIVIRIFNENNEIYDWLDPSEYVRDLEVGGPYIHNFKRFFNYKTSSESVKDMITDGQRLEDLNKLGLKAEIENKEQEMNEIKSKIDSLFEELSKSEEEYKKLNDQVSMPSKKMKVTQDYLIQENELGYKEIKEDMKEFLRYLDLSKIDFTNVDVRGIDFRECNPVFLDPQTVYNKDLSNTNFSVDEFHTKDYVFDSTSDFKEVNISGADLRHKGAIIVSFDGAITDENTLLPGDTKKVGKRK